LFTRLLASLLRPIYYLLYHHFAWTYDLAADIVSLGQWRNWARAALPHLDGRGPTISAAPKRLAAT